MNRAEEIRATPQMEISTPRRLTPGAILVVNAYGLILFLPVLIAILAVSTLSLSMLTWLIPGMVVAVVTFFLPVGFGNPRMRNLVRSQDRLPGAGEACWLVQLTCAPRVRSGLRALLEDADDIGLLSVEGSALVFRGDSIRLTVPFAAIQKLRRRSIGWRGLFAYGPRTALTVSGLPGAERLEFSERSSWTIPGSRKESRRLFTRISEALAQGKAQT